jgi:WD40 repeat protein
MSGDDGSIVVVETEDGTERHRVNGLAQPCLLSYLDDRRLLCLLPGGAAEFDLGDLTPIGVSTAVGAPVGHLAVTPEKDRVLAGAGSALVEIDREGAVHPTPVGDLPLDVSSVALSPDGERVAVVGYGVDDPAAVRAAVVDRASGALRFEVTVLDEDQAGGEQVVWSPEGERLAVSVSDGSVAVLDAATGETVVRRQVDSFGARALQWPSPAELYQGGQDGVFRVLDPESLSVVREHALSEQLNLTDIEPVPGSGLVVTASEDGFVRFVDPATAETVGEPVSADGTQLQSVAVSPDGRRIAATSRDGALRLWDRTSGRPIGPPLQAHDIQAVGVAWIGDRTLVTASFGGTVIAWDTSPEAWVDRACGLAGRDLTQEEWDRHLPDQPYRAVCSGT